ncbi:MAG: amidohydrolase family protein [Oscillospiraceae bacterium]|jgi:imidazolonepropionase-like amidohydrolase|nr:amidohydrolase family protein [Oscillospiraceae bacterium]
MLITHAKIYTMSNVGLIEDGFIFVKDGTIEKIGSMALCPKISDFKGAVIDIKSMNLFPGFIDSSTTMGNTCLDDQDQIFKESKSDLIAPHLRVLDSVNLKDPSFKEALFSGVTTVIIFPFSTRLISGQILACKTFGKKIDNMIINSSASVKINLKKVIGSNSNIFLLGIIRESLLKAKKYIEDKEFAISNLDRCETPTYDIKHESLVRVLEREVPALIDAETREEIFAAIRIAKEFSMKIVLVNPLDISLVTDEVLSENVAVLCSPFCVRNDRHKTSDSFSKIPGFLNKMKIPTAITSNHPKFPSNFLTLAASVAVNAGMDWLEAIKSITIYAAKINGISDHVGSIEENKDADFVVFEKDPLDIFQKPKLVVCNGEKILDNL